MKTKIALIHPGIFQRIYPGNTPLKKKELLTEEKYQEAFSKYGSNFTAKIGAEGVRDLLKELDLDTYRRRLRRDLEKSKEVLANRKSLKALKITEDFKKSGNKYRSSNFLPFKQSF